MREITSHKVNGINESIKIVAVADQVDGTTTWYDISRSNVRETTSIPFYTGRDECDGVITNEVLLAIVEDRLKGFQSGPFSCRENSIALTKVQEAMMWLHRRTREREQRGVEGTHQK